MNEPVFVEKLATALIAAQKLDSRLRGARNKGAATDRDVADCKECIARLRAIADRHGLPTEDIDRRKDLR